MPPAVPLVAAVAGAAVASSSAVIAALGAFGAGVLGGISSFAINAIGGRALSKKPKSASFSPISDQGLKQIVRLSDDTSKIIYGKARIGGTLDYHSSSSSGPDSDGITQTGDNLFLHMVIVHTCHEVDSFVEFYLNDKLVTVNAGGFVQEAPYMKDGKSYVRLITHKGEDSQAADSLLVAESTNWTSDHRLRGHAYTYMRLQWNQEVFTGGVPVLNVVIKGKKVYDPRSTLTVWSDNAALCIHDYITSRDVISIPYGLGADADEIDEDFTIAAANICDETITKIDASTIARYTCNGIVDTGKEVLANLEALVSSLAGAVTYSKGRFRIHAGAYDTPESDVVDEDWLHGGIKMRARMPRQELYNAVKGVYISPEKGWQSDDFPAIVSSTFEAQDGGERIYTDIELPYTTDPEAAQRIARIILLKGREQITVNMAMNYRALKFAVWDTIKLNNDKFGWAEKVFRITNLTIDLAGGIAVELKEENSTSYNWSTGDAEAVDAAPDTNLPDAFTVEVPSSVAYNSRAAGTVGGDTVYNLVLSWDYHSNAFVNSGGQFEIQFKESTETDWRPSFFVNGNLTTSDIVTSSVNTEYDLRIRAVNMLGAKSNWVTIENAIIGSTGGIGGTLDYGNWTTSASAFLDYGDWSTSPTAFGDYGSFS